MSKQKAALIDEIVDDDPDTVAHGVPPLESPEAPINHANPFYWRVYFTERKDLQGNPIKLPKQFREMRISSKDAKGPGEAKRIYARERGRGYTPTQLNSMGLTAVALQASEETIRDYPWGWMVKHPSFGSLRLRTDEAANMDEAKRVYCERKAQGMTMDALEKTGLRISVQRFRPADTEVGK